MVKPNASLKSSLRKSVIGAYRARGTGNNNLWLVFSIKTNQDWLIPSDRQLIHWLYFLETNPDVQTFDLAPEPILSNDDVEIRATELDATVINRDGSIEWHEVKAGKNSSDVNHESQKRAQINAANIARASYKRFNDSDLESKIKVSLRWLKAIGFASAIRDQEHIPCRTSLAVAIKELKSGDIKSILNELEGYETTIVLGLLVRFAIEGFINLDLTNRTFGLLTNWKYRG